MHRYHLCHEPCFIESKLILLNIQVISGFKLLKNNEGNVSLQVSLCTFAYKHVGYCCGISVEDVLHSFMLSNICLVMQRCILLHLFSSVKLCDFNCLKRLIGLIKR